ncbi:MAG: M3 family metallopeptidase, partial [Pirellula sp.]
AFLSEKKSQALYAISQEELRPYFSLNKVMTGLFTILDKLYGMSMEELNKNAIIAKTCG